MKLRPDEIQRLGSIREAYRENLYASVIPFWEEHSIDREHGGYLTCLDRDGSVYDYDKFMWLQAREAWMFSHLYNRVRPEPRWLEFSSHGIDFLEQYGADEQGNFYFALRRDGKPLVAPYNIYSDCFAVLAYAEYGKASGNSEMIRRAEAILSNIEGRRARPKGIYTKQITQNRPIRAFGFSMIELNMAQVMAQVTGDEQYHAKIDTVIDDILRYHISRDDEVVYERVLPDGSHPFCMEGRLLCPGHTCEVLWFLAKSVSDKALLRTLGDALRWTLERGWDPVHGGIFYYQDVRSLPTEKLESEMKLWWVHNEAAYAALLLGYLNGDHELLDWFFTIHDWSWERFVDHEHGEWYGYLYHTGEVAKSLKGGKWKGFFHLPRFLLESLGTIDEMLRTAGGSGA